MIPYGRQSINNEDVRSVIKVLKSDFLTQGPEVKKFEDSLASYCKSKYAVVFSNGTAALQAAYFSAGFKKGDEFITTPLTFASTVSAGLWFGSKPVFSDVDIDTGNLDPDKVIQKINKKTKAIVAVDYAGQPADLDKFKMIAKKYKLLLIEDACHALGAEYKGKKIGSISDMTIFSFHPIKSITTGEGGAVLTNNRKFYEKLQLFRTHGITKERKLLKDKNQGGWYYEMQELGLNYRLTDFQCALGTSQLKKLDSFIKKRQAIVDRYGEFLKKERNIILPVAVKNTKPSWHLYAIRLNGKLAKKRKEIFGKLREAGIGVQVHYIPVYLHPYYKNLGYKKGLCLKAEKFYQTEISLPIYPDLTLQDQKLVVKKLKVILDR